MKDSNELILGNIIKLTRSSENKFKRGNFKGALDDKIKANEILKSKSCDEKMIQEYRKELSSLYSSKFDLIFDHKLKINEIKINEIVEMLERKSEEKFKLGNFKGAIDDKMKANEILKSKSCDEKIIEKYREELSSLYSSKFDLIFDHKLKIDAKKINEIVKLLENKSEQKLKNLDYRGAIKALRRAEKYISN